MIDTGMTSYRNPWKSLIYRVEYGYCFSPEARWLIPEFWAEMAFWGNRGTIICTGNEVPWLTVYTVFLEYKSQAKKVSTDSKIFGTCIAFALV